MSELKVYHCNEWHNEYTEFYIKSEADKVIAELEESHKMEVGQLLIEIAELKNKINESQTELELWRDGSIISEAHQKELDGKQHSDYKRCFAMAKWCFTKSNYHYILARHGEDVKENNRKSILYSRWRRRWLELAKQFKEEN